MSRKKKVLNNLNNTSTGSPNMALGADSLISMDEYTYAVETKEILMGRISELEVYNKKLCKDKEKLVKEIQNLLTKIIYLEKGNLKI